MTIKSGNYITSDDIKQLKADVKAEMLARSNTGSVSAYGGTDYDYTVVPGNNVPILIEHFNKNQIPLSKVNSSNTPSQVTKNDPVLATNLSAMQAEVTDLATKRATYAQTATSLSQTGCDAQCTGLCYTACTGGCKTGCTGTCTGDCGSNVCQGTCFSDCAIFCASACSGQCDTTCTKTCADDCIGTCSTTCRGGCKMTSTGCANCASGVSQM